MTTAHSLYQTDFYGWTQFQAQALREGKLHSLDIENLIEEVESMGKSEQRELRSRLVVLLMRLLKWQFQPQRRGASWEATIKEQRLLLTLHLQENPSLKNKIAETFPIAYQLARLAAVKETSLPSTTFPQECPWTFEEIMATDFWPDSPQTPPAI